MPDNKVLDNNALLAIRDYINDSIGDLPGPPSNRYQHSIRLYNSSTGYHITFNIITTKSTAYTYNSLPKALYDLGFTSSSKVCPANGFYLSTTSMRGIVGVYCSSSSATGTTIYYRYVELASMSTSNQTATLKAAVADSYTSISLSSSWTVQDTITYVVW